MSATATPGAAPATGEQRYSAATVSNENACILIGLPHYGDVCAQALEGMLLATAEDIRWRIEPGWCSILPHNFNCLLCKAFNSRQSHGWTHFGLHHADIEASAGWLDTLLAEMDRHDADVISTVVPIKDSRGVTSTGWMEPDTGRITRFTMHEVYNKLPATFDAQTACPGKWLMVNTGLWVARLDVLEDFPGFEFRSCIQKCDDGKRRAVVLPEDWAFSEWCARQGLRVFATRAVKVSHHGKTQFLNDHPWGEWETDRGDLAAENKAPATKADGAEAIHGWTQPEELAWLREQAARARVVVEVGSWHGRSTYALAETCPGVIYAIDHFAGSPGDRAAVLADAKTTGPEARRAFRENLAAFLDTGEVVLLDTHSDLGLASLSRRGVKADLIFLDGAHDYASVCMDIRAAKDVLAPGGLLCGHDLDREGVRQAVAELCPGWKQAAGWIWEWRPKAA